MTAHQLAFDLEIFNFDLIKKSCAANYKQRSTCKTEILWNETCDLYSIDSFVQKKPLKLGSGSLQLDTTTKGYHSLSHSVKI